MSKARDISNLFSASTAAATDAEVTSAIATHASNTTNRHYQTGTTENRPATPNVGDLYFDTTLDRLIEYRSTGWKQISEVPNAPTNIVATLTGSDSVSVSFTAPTNVPVVSYTVTSSPGNISASGASSPLSISGLTPNTAYTFLVVAQGYNGNSQPGTSNSVTPVLPTVTGGTLYTSDATHFYRKFNSTDTFSISLGNLSADILVIAGGGGGGYNKAGGGGAGKVIYATGQSLSGSYTVTIGGGGAGSTGSSSSKGTNTSFGSLIVAEGGGLGGNESTSGGVGGSGGAGGRFGSGAAASSYSGPGTAYGNSGGAGMQDTSPYRGGGGGGSGGNGAGGGGGGTGGAGLNIWSTWATITSSGVSGFYAGGGGGGAYLGSGGSGGSGGGGKGGDTNENGVTAPSNSGSGGGGGGNVLSGGTGGSGIVIVRYLKTAVST